MMSPPAPSGSARFPIVVAALVAANLMVYLAQLAGGVHWMEPRIAQLIVWGANVAPFTLTGEPWRLFASIFLHIGFIHLALNMYLLAVLGPLLEREFGKLRFALLYVISGLAGSITSALWHAHHKVSKSAYVMGQFMETSDLQLVVAAGASGALLGMCGAFLGRVLATGVGEHDRHALSIKGPAMQTIAIIVVMGFLNPGIDHASHIGGLIGGFVLGVAFSLLTFAEGPARRLLSLLAVSGASLGLIWWLVTQPPSKDLLRLKRVLQVQLAPEVPAAPPSPSAR